VLSNLPGKKIAPGVASRREYDESSSGVLSYPDSLTRVSLPPKVFSLARPTKFMRARESNEVIWDNSEECCFQSC